MIAIVNADLDWGIGKEGELLLHIPEDMKYFREQTSGEVVVMGRKTLESFPGKKPLKNRVNMVLTRQSDYRVEGAEIVHEPGELLERVRAYEAAGRRVFLIGGGALYNSLLSECSEALVTRTQLRLPADCYFPNLDALPDWTLAEQGEMREREGVHFCFCRYIRV